MRAEEEMRIEEEMKVEEETRIEEEKPFNYFSTMDQSFTPRSAFIG